MNKPVPPAHTSSDGTWRWLVGGLAFGGVVLGLLVAAYAIGYRNGQHQTLATAPPAPTTGPVATTGAATTAPSPIGPVPVTAALVARGKSLYQADGCSACHSLSGSAGDRGLRPGQEAERRSRPDRLRQVPALETQRPDRPGAVAPVDGEDRSEGAGHRCPGDSVGRRPRWNT